MAEERDLDKLGTVLAMFNNTNRRALSLLERQQRRQARIVWTSLAIVAVAFIVVGFGTFCTYSAVASLKGTIKELHYYKMEYINTGLPCS